MATDDERRRVAAALRAYDGKGADADTIGGVMAIIIGAGDFEGWSWREVFARLADLIGPNTTKTAEDTTKTAEDTTKTTEDTTKAPKSSEITPTSSDKAPNSHLYSGTVEVGTSQVPECDATATCDVSQSRRDAVACDPTGRGVDSIYEWCRERLEGADGAEDYLYCTIMRAIEDYRHPELATAYTVRAVDREALLALADELDDCGLDGWACGPVDVGGFARRIREALGVVA